MWDSLQSAMHPWLWHMINVGPSCMCTTSAKSYQSQTASFVQWLVVVYFASIVDNAMVGWFFHFHEMIPMSTRNTYLAVDPPLTWIGSPYSPQMQSRPSLPSLHIWEFLPNLVWNTFHFLLYISRFFVWKFWQCWIRINWNSTGSYFFMLKCLRT